MIRHIVIHYHIFKNGGSTIDSILKKNFSPYCTSLEGQKPWETLGSKNILDYVNNNPNIRVISSHHARLPEPISSTIVFYPIIFLRHPIDRVGSVYSFERRQPKDSPSLGAQIARENNIAEYVKWRLSVGNGCVIKNFQTVHLAGRERDMRIAHATKHDLNMALNRLNNLPFIGIVEFFEESISRMKKYLLNGFGPIDTSFSIHNKSNDRKRSLKERIEDLQISLGKCLYDELIENNKLDIELYSYVLKILSHQNNNNSQNFYAQ